MKLIKIFCNWTDSASITNRFINNFITPENYSKDIQFTLDNNYDVALVFNYTNEQVNFNKVVCSIQEPSFSSHIKPEFLKRCNTVLFHDKSLISDLDNITEVPIMMFNHFTTNLTELLKQPIVKTKKMSMIASSLNGSHNYTFRHSLFKAILESELEIDLYGQDWIGLQSDSRFKGRLNNKLDGIRDYEFSIGIENTCEKGYTSEKFTDLIVNETVPVYYGNPNVKAIYDIKGFINIPNTNVEETIEFLRYILDNGDYNTYKPALLENKQKCLTDYNLYNYIKKLII